MSEGKKEDSRIVHLQGPYPSSMSVPGMPYSPDPRVTTYSDRGQASNYAERLFASTASVKLGEEEYSKMMQSGRSNLAFYLLMGIVFAAMSTVSFIDLFIELATGEKMILITGYFHGGYSYKYLDPSFFAVTASLGLLLALVFFRASTENVSKLRMLKHLREESG